MKKKTKNKKSSDKCGTKHTSSQWFPCETHSHQPLKTSRHSKLTTWLWYKATIVFAPCRSKRQIYRRVDMECSRGLLKKTWTGKISDKYLHLVNLLPHFVHQNDVRLAGNKCHTESNGPLLVFFAKQRKRDTKKKLPQEKEKRLRSLPSCVLQKPRTEKRKA